MADQYSDHLSAYLDGELDPARRRRIETHLAGCAECAATLADLRAIVAAAPGYAGRPPARDLWPPIARRLGQPEIVPYDRAVAPQISPGSRAPRRFSWPQLVAASFLMAALGGGATWLALHRGAPAAVPLAAAPGLGARDSLKTVAYAEEQYDAAVRDLQQVLDAGRSRLDTATVRTIELSLQKIDAAIAEARAAVQRDPANGYLSRQIAANMRRKLDLLRVATNAIAART